MAITFVFGRAGSGKTRRCLDEILARLETATPTDVLLLLVPEQATFELERELAMRSPRGGYCRAEVLSFSRLSQRLLAELPDAPQRLTASARRLALRALCRDVPLAAAFGPAAREPGFFRQLDQMLAELMREDISPEILEQAAARIEARSLRRRVEALADIAQRYEQWLGPDRVDPAAQLRAARRQIEAAEWTPRSEIWIDGFAGMTAQESATIVALARRCRRMVITALVPPEFDPRASPEDIDDFGDLFAPTKRTVLDWITRFQQSGIELLPPERLDTSPPPRFARAPQLARLEWGLSRPGDASESTGEADPDVRIIACETPRDEFVAAAREIRSRMIAAAGALRYRDFAIIGRDLSAAERLAADVLSRYEIPFFIDTRRPLRGHALERFVQGLFDVLIDNFRPASTCRLLRSGLLPLSNAEAEALEQIVRRHGVRGLRAWSQPHWEFADEPAELAAARRRIASPFEPLRSLCAGSISARTWVETLYNMLVALDVPKKLLEWARRAESEERWESASLHRLAWSELVAVLDEAHDIVADTPLTLPEAREILGGALSDRSRGLPPPALDQVLISAVERSRHPEIRFAWVLGMNDGVFPRRPPQDAFLNASARTQLVAAGLPNLASADQRLPAERLLGYIGMTRPSDGLVLSYAQRDEDGTPLFRSALLDDVQAALPNVKVEYAKLDLPLTLEEAINGFLEARGGGSSCSRALYGALLSRLRRKPSQAHAVRERLAGLHFRNAPPAVPPPAPLADDDATFVWSGSPTEIDRYVQCPFQHFAMHRLALQDAADPPAVQLDLGSAAHAVLAELGRLVIRSRRAPNAVGAEQWEEWIDQSVATRLRDRAPDMSARQPELKLFQDIMFEQLRSMMKAHIARWLRGASAPLHVEHDFRDSARGKLPSLRLDVGEGRIARVHGRIDRIDHCRTESGEALLIYDYKSTASRLRSEYLTGVRLQLLTYLLAVQHAYRGNADMQIGGVLVAPLYPEGATLEKGYVTCAGEQERGMYLYRPRGIFDEALAEQLDRQLGSTESPVVAMRVTKENRLAATSDGRSRDEIRQRLDLAERSLSQAVRGIVSGKIDVAPLIEGRRLACAYCSYRSVCRYDPRLNRPRHAAKSLPTLAPAGDSSTGAEGEAE